MDNLKLAFKIVASTAKQKRDAGEVPAFLGVRGMLALMHDRIVKFSKHDEDSTEYVLELAVSAMFALACVLPEAEFESDEETTTDETDKPMQPNQQPEDVDVSDSRWTAVPPGQPLPTSRQVNDERTES